MGLKGSGILKKSARTNASRIITSATNRAIHALEGGNITATSNDTLTTLSSLALPVGQLTGAGNLTESTSSILTVTGGAGATLTNTSIQVKQATTTESGFLSSTDWNTFNNKQSTLTNPVTSLSATPTANQIAVFNATGTQFR
jgi:hypothetical protein